MISDHHRYIPLPALDEVLRPALPPDGGIEHGVEVADLAVLVGADLLPVVVAWPALAL